MSTAPQQPPSPEASSAARAPETSAPATSAAALRGNPLGKVSLVAAILLFLAQLASQLFWPFLHYFRDQFDLPFSAFNLILQAPIILFALTATITGIIALVMKGRRRTAALIGTTLGVTTLALQIVAVVVAAVASSLPY